ECRVCKQAFVSKNALQKHLKKTGHNKRDASSQDTPRTAKAPLAHRITTSTAKIPLANCITKDEPGLAVRGCADGPAQYHYNKENFDVIDPSPCAVYDRYFDTKRQFFSHLLGARRHWRDVRYVLKRKRERENEVTVDVEMEDERLAKWMRKDMIRQD
ncbi:hypothetical protein EK21DRAFT_29323, partial [Setomelanomma holmii]